MRLSIFLFIAAVISYSTTDALTQVSDKTFKLIVLDSNKYVLVDFYADWCRHCKKLMPTLEELNEKFSDYSNQIDFVKVNGDKDGKIMGRKYSPIGYPTVLLFHGKDSDPIEFNGLRDLDSLSNFVQQVTGIRLNKIKEDDPVEIVPETDNTPSTPEVITLNENNYSELVENSSDPIIIAFGATWCEYCRKLDPVFDELATKIYANDNLKFAKVTLDQADSNYFTSKFKIETIPTIIYFNNNLQKDYVIHKGDQSYKKMTETINKLYDLSRDIHGKPLPNSGNLKQIDDLLNSKLNLNTNQISQEGLSILSTINSPKAGYYKKIFNQLIKGDTLFIQFEIKRISSILSNGIDKLSDKLIDSLKQRLDVLKSFAKL